MDENITLKTPSKYELKLRRNYLLRGERKQIKAVYSKMFQLSDIPVKDLQGKNNEALERAKMKIDLSHDDDEAVEMIFGFLVTYIKTPQGEEIRDGFVEWLNKQRDTIADEILKTFNEATKETQTIDQEKKS